MNNKDLKSTDPLNFSFDEENKIFLGLALIVNDIADLMYLQGLHEAERIKLNINIKELSAESGAYSGRNIYIFRLTLSHLYNMLEFFYERRKDIRNNTKMQKYIKRLSKPEKMYLKSFMELVEKYKIYGKESFSIKGIRPEIINILKLSEAARNDLTFHYHGSPKYLEAGFKIAFYKQNLPNTKFAYITELFDINKDRNYYIDVATQKYLENKIGIENIFANIEDLLSFIGNVNKIIKKILKTHHSSMKFAKVK